MEDTKMLERQHQERRYERLKNLFEEERARNLDLTFNLISCESLLREAWGWCPLTLEADNPKSLRNRIAKYFKENNKNAV